MGSSDTIDLLNETDRFFRQLLKTPSVSILVLAFGKNEGNRR